jgi:hypothetical protein
MGIEFTFVKHFAVEARREFDAQALKRELQDAQIEAEAAYAYHVARLMRIEGSIEGECTEVTPAPRLTAPDA